MLVDSTTVTLPFDFSAVLSGYQSGADAFTGRNPIFTSANFAGGGTVTAHFTALPPGPTPLFDLHDATYQFSASSTAPTPEPATLLLFGVGAGSVFLRRRRR